MSKKIKHIRIILLKENDITFLQDYNTVVTININKIDKEILDWLELNSLKDYYSILNRTDEFYLKIN